MPIIPQGIDGFYGGVSQQSPATRSNTQVEEAKNCQFSIAKGASKRSPIEVINLLTSTDLSDAFCHWISDDNGDDYLLVVRSETIDVYRMSDGLKLNVDNDTAQVYLNCTNPKEDIRALTVRGNTYILNTTVVTGKTASTAAGVVAGTAQSLQAESLDSVPDQSIYRIIGHSSTEFDTYYAKKSGGAWYEWVEPGIEDELDNTTMPHILKIEFNQVDPGGVKFIFEPVTWEKRKVGDDKSNKFPSFIGDTITGLFWGASRLGLLSKTAVSMSELDEPHNLFKTTVTDVLDTGRIDIQVKDGNTSPFRWAKPLSKNIVLFTDDQQYFVSGHPVITPATVRIDLATKYQTSKHCEPTNAGSNLYFATTTGNHTRVREMYVQDEIVSTIATDVTAHVPEYIPKDVTAMEAHNNLDFLCLYSEETPGKLWVYNFYFNGDQKVQSAWGHWDLHPNMKITNMKVVDHYLYFVFTFTYTIDEVLQTTTTESFLGRINLKINDVGEYDNPFDYPICLDFLNKVSTTYDGGQNRTLLLHNFPVMCPEIRDSLQVVLGTGHTPIGRMFKYNTVYTFNPFNTPYGFYVAGDFWDDGDVFVGSTYNQELTLSRMYYKEVMNSRVQIRNLVLSYVDTAHFDFNVEVRGLDDNNITFLTHLAETYVARTTGTSYYNTNTPQVATDSYRFPVLGAAANTTIKLTNDGYIGANWVKGEYEALVTSRTRRI